MVKHVKFLPSSTFGGGRYDCLVIFIAELYQPCLVEMNDEHFDVSSAPVVTEAELSSYFSIVVKLQQFSNFHLISKN